MQTIGLIGTGIMGQGMARNLMRAGFSVQIYNRTRAKAAALEAEGTLAIMVGGDEPVFRSARPILDAMGSNVVWEGGPGAGQHTKMANQIAIAGALAGVCEALAYARAAGLDEERVYRTIRTGAARSGQMDAAAPKILAGDLSAAFYLRHFVKDMGIASGESKGFGLTLEVLEQVLAASRELEAQGHGGEGTQALIRRYWDLP